MLEFARAHVASTGPEGAAAALASLGAVAGKRLPSGDPAAVEAISELRAGLAAAETPETQEAYLRAVSNLRMPELERDIAALAEGKAATVRAAVARALRGQPRGLPRGCGSIGAPNARRGAPMTLSTFTWSFRASSWLAAAARRASSTLGLAVLASALWSPAADAAVPARLSVQGRLANAAGGPISDGAYGLELSLTLGESGPVLYTEKQLAVAVADGVFSTTIGDDGTGLPMATIAAANDVWFRVTVGGEPPLPAQRLDSVPYAFAAEHAAVAAAVSPQGSGSGLDADLLDGKDLSEILTGTATEAKQDAILAALATLNTPGGLSASLAPLATSAGVTTTVNSAVANLATKTDVTTSVTAAVTGLATKTDVTTAAAPLGTAAKQDQILAKLDALTVAVKALGPRNYSKDCNDFADKGWPSKAECLADGRWHYAGSLSTIIAAGSYALLTDYQVGTSVTNGNVIVPSSFSTYNCMFSMTQSVPGQANDNGATSYYNVAYWGSGGGCPGTFIGRYAYYDDLAGQAARLASSGGTVGDALNWQVWIRK